MLIPQENQVLCSQHHYILSHHNKNAHLFLIKLIKTLFSVFRNYLENTTGDKILIIQSDFDEGSQRLNVIASAK